MRGRTKPPTSSLIAAGDTLVYANGKRASVVNLLWLNGQPGVQLDDDDPLFLSDRFMPLKDVEKWVRLELWAVERAEERAR